MYRRGQPKLRCPHSLPGWFCSKCGSKRIDVRPNWKEQPMARWSVDVIRKRSEHLGVVTAPNEKEALAKAIKQFEVEPARQNRITVTKISDRNDD
jgi:hypothetical protein